jgi:rSAM/selenodomain-associated transferase 2
MNPKLSIIIPVYRESACISAALEQLLEMDIPIPYEIIVSDGESPPGTLAHLRSAKIFAQPSRIRLISAPRGRGPQMNSGAKSAAGELLLFLHVDTRIDQRGMGLMIRAWQDHGGSFFCGAFDLHIDSRQKIFRMIERVASARSRFTKIPYGDQGIFMSQKLFEKINGFPDVPIMEDVGIMSKIKKQAVVPVFIAHPVSTSARRWQDQGIVFTSVRNWILISLYILGVPPRVLARYY